MSIKMNKISSTVWGLLACVVLVGSANSAPKVSVSEQVAFEVNMGSDWTVKTEDSVVGVSAARQITNPAKVNYSKLLKATPEMKEIKKDGIDKNSAQGLVLVSKAKARVARVSREIMTAKGYCSVWKKISHKKEQAVTDITALVKAKLAE